MARDTNENETALSKVGSNVWPHGLAPCELLFLAALRLLLRTDLVTCFCLLLWRLLPRRLASARCCGFAARALLLPVVVAFAAQALFLPVVVAPLPGPCFLRPTP